jgi:hypothetical protein
MGAYEEAIARQDRQAEIEAEYPRLRAEVARLRERAERAEQAGYVVVPRVPTRRMLEAAWADALNEDAAAVWASMIEAAGLDAAPAGEGGDAP